MSGKEIRLGFGGGNVRIWIPFTFSGLRYYWTNRKWPVIGVYGFDRFIQDRDRLHELRHRVVDLEDQLKIKNERLKEMGKELSEFKRGNKEAGKLQKRIDQLEKELEEARTLGWD